MFQNYGGYPPSQPIVFIPSPSAAPAAGGFDIDGITRQIAGLEALKKLMKEEKKEDKKPDKSDPSVVSMMLLMILISPVTGPVMSWFFTKGTGLLH